VDDGEVVAELLAALARGRDDLRGGDTTRVLDRWRRYGRPLLGRRVTFTNAEGTFGGVAEDIDEAGALVVSTPRGSMRVVAGEVQWL
jgi:biotin-(acetyl-CoA carboxylase) ligase